MRSSLRHINIGSTDEQIRAGILQMQKDGLDSEFDLELKMLEFLYIKQVAQGDDNRTSKFRFLLDPEIASSPAQRLFYHKARGRLLRLFVRDGDHTSETIPENVQSFPASIMSLPQ